MAISKSFKMHGHSVQWNGEEAATVRGLTPNDITKILLAEGEGVLGLFGLRDEIDLKGVDLKDTNAVADVLMEQGPNVLIRAASTMPLLIARIIGVAGDDDSDETVFQIATTWPLPLQFEILGQIARMTFVGPEGFRQFLGNVSTLMKSLGAITNVKNPSPRPGQEPESKVLDAGSLAFASSVPS